VLKASACATAKQGGRRTAGLGYQFRLFWWRSVLQLLRSGTLISNCVAMGAAGALQGFINMKLLSATPPVVNTYVMKYTQLFFLLVLTAAITSIQMALPLFGSERPVFWRESRHFSIPAFALGKWTAALPLTLLHPLVVLSFWYQLVQPAASFSSLYLALVLIQWAAEGHGHLISLLANANMQLTGGVAAMVAAILAGAVPRLSQLPHIFTYISFGSFGRWGMQLLMGLEYYPWYYSKGGFPPPPSPSNSSAPSDISCFWDPTPDCSQREENQDLADAIFAALKAMNVSIGQLNCTQVAQCPALNSAMTNLTHDIQELLHDPWEMYQDYLLKQELSHMAKSHKHKHGCMCFCGYAGMPDTAGDPMPTCPEQWYGKVPYCNSTKPFNPLVDGLGPLTEYSDAIATCSVIAGNGYELPYGASPLLSRGPMESVAALTGLGIIARVLTFFALLCVDRRKRT